MKLKPLSASSIKTYLQCLAKYKFRYIDKKPQELNKEPLALGTAVHTALEEMYKLADKFGYDNIDEAFYDDILKVFMESARERIAGFVPI